MKFRVRIGGSADSGFTAAVGAPTVCGTCPIGEKAHSPDEVCHIDTLIPRAKALALVAPTRSVNQGTRHDPLTIRVENCVVRTVGPAETGAPHEEKTARPLLDPITSTLW